MAEGHGRQYFCNSVCSTAFARTIAGYGVRLGPINQTLVDADRFEARADKLKTILELKAPPLIVAEFARMVIEAFNGFSRERTLNWIQERWQEWDQGKVL
jgi:hypothetical protein